MPFSVLIGFQQIKHRVHHQAYTVCSVMDSTGDKEDDDDGVYR